MKYLKYFNINESLDDARQDLRDIFTDLIDEGYDVDVFKGYDDSGKDEYRASVWADGTRILYRYFSTLAYNKDTVEKALKGEAGISGFTGENGKQYAPNPIFK